MSESCELVGGPQDGGKVHFSADTPEIIFVGPKWLGDGFVAWSRGLSKRFPAKYVYHGGKFRPFLRYPDEEPTP
jgi:hypothetical protein